MPHTIPQTEALFDDDPAYRAINEAVQASTLRTHWSTVAAACTDALAIIGLFWAMRLWLERLAVPLAHYSSCLQCGRDARRSPGEQRFCDATCGGKWLYARMRLVTEVAR